jgi:hypothetical protein
MSTLGLKQNVGPDWNSSIQRDHFIDKGKGGDVAKRGKFIVGIMTQDGVEVRLFCKRGENGKGE